MTSRLIFRPAAEAELAEAFHWYEARRTGLGFDLLRAVEARLAAVQENPVAFPVVHQRIRRALVRRFPYGIYYTVEADAIVVLAVFHAKRNPKHWKRRT